MPQWVTNCYSHYLQTEKRLPTMRELLLWRKAFD
jgi:hypothetical protein